LKPNTLWWGGIGASIYSLYYLRKNIYENQFSKYYGVYYIVYPIAGLGFGIGLSAILASGFIALNAYPSDIVFYGTAFLGGLLQNWALSTLYDISQSLSKSNTSKSAK
jgi:hypothetical protein